MSEVKLYKIGICVHDAYFETVQRGYLTFVEKVELQKFPTMRIRDIGGALWCIKTSDIKYMKIEEVEDFEEPAPVDE